MLSIFCFVTLLCSVCIQNDFVRPPVNDNGVELNASHTIADIKDYFVKGEFTEITDELLVDAIIVADDGGGSFYKKLVLQDETGGIEILLNRKDIYTTYKEGREVGLKVKGLYIGDYGGVLQLGGSTSFDKNGNPRLGQVEDAQIDKIFLLGSQVGLPAPKEMSLTEFGPSDISTLVKLCDLQFTATDTTGQFADTVAKKTLNKQLEDCASSTLVVRTNWLADLATTDVPNGNGCITGIYGVYRKDKQLAIRSASDIKLDGERCTGSNSSTGNGGGVLTPGTVSLTIEDVRGMFSGTSTRLPVDQSIQGVVISDEKSGSTNGRNMIIQQDGWGIIVRFDDFHNFSLGDEVFLDVSGVELSEYYGGLQLQNVGLDKAALVRKNKSLTPRVLSVAEITSNFERYEGTLITIKGATLTADNEDWARTTNLSDGTGSLAVFTYEQSSFAGDSPPLRAVDITGYLNEYKGPQLIIRTLADVVETDGSVASVSNSDVGIVGGTGSRRTILDEGFQGNADYDPVSAKGWLNFTSVTNGRKWQARKFKGNTYAQATAYKDKAPNVDAWLVTPQLDFSVGLQISFETATAYNSHEGLEVVVSTDYTGVGDPSTATWTALEGAEIVTGNSADNKWVPSGNVSLKRYSGQGFIAFRYTGSGSGSTSTFRVDNVVISTL